MQTTAFRICPLCEACCGLELKITGDHIDSIRGDEADVFSKGYICPKAVALKDLHLDPDRLRSPLIKRDGQFVEASWEEAFAEIKQRLPVIHKNFGNDAIALTVGNPAAHKIGLLMYFSRLARALGSKNIFSASTLDQMPKQLSSGLMFGSWLSIPVPDIERTDLLVVIGGNPMVSNGSLWTVPDFRGKAKTLKARGGKLIVIDPRRTETADIADEHHFIRPASDVFLLAGVINALFESKRTRLGHLEQYVNGVEAIQTAIKVFTPEKAALQCGIPASTIRDLARQIADAKRAVLYGRIGTCTQRFGTVASWLVDVINVLTGHLDSEGGAMFPKAPAFATNTFGESGKGKGITTGRHHSRVSNAPEVYGELPMGLLTEEIETAGSGQVKALITVASNPVLSSPDGQRLEKALDSLDFMVSLDIYVNETSRFADVILPGLSPLEEAHYDVAFPQFSYRNQARFSPAIFAPPVGHVPEWQVLARLAEMLGGPPASSVVAPLDLLDASLKAGPYSQIGMSLDNVKASPHGIDLGPLQPRIPEALRTPSGKIELAPIALLTDLQIAAERLHIPIPELVIIGRRQVRSNNSWMHNLPTLAKGPFRCTVLVNPIDAAKFKLTDGAMATITALNSITVQVEISEEMMPGVISVPHGWGHNKAGAQLRVAQQRPGANINELFDASQFDPLSGNAILSGISVQLKAA
jgi:anaerobic selenocysteine-containing dehydrogenase